VLFDVGPLARAKGANLTDARQELIAAVGETLTKAIRGSDLAIRWSSDALLLVLPGLNLAEARLVAERVRAAMQAGGSHHAMVAAGVAELESFEAFATVIARANEKLQIARERGHNRVA
jgi:PleD family two-component response regulator